MSRPTAPGASVRGCDRDAGIDGGQGGGGRNRSQAFATSDGRCGGTICCPTDGAGGPHDPGRDLPGADDPIAAPTHHTPYPVLPVPKTGVTDDLMGKHGDPSDVRSVAAVVRSVAGPRSADGTRVQSTQERGVRRSARHPQPTFRSERPAAVPRRLMKKSLDGAGAVPDAEFPAASTATCDDTNDDKSMLSASVTDDGEVDYAEVRYGAAGVHYGIRHSALQRGTCMWRAVRHALLGADSIQPDATHHSTPHHSTHHSTPHHTTPPSGVAVRYTAHCPLPTTTVQQGTHSAV